ncbi:MAG: mitochondrial fission ELM1 family protein [Candidatus Omnitrophica bacterium]|nr:mitochondrial fission ELM1 family protein [Candidatus Omnitrophota bacterium]MBU1128136.1 mitochondrial fission ELM1 family protein [Candidatus Omnitrophota bacterium]MBU1784330.1 mitochondrial fission ELM1 family protein [Candidatus Omnitrophota bacterium]MBU1850790.1 mitochondrial fission ELM1 family protein [Candidatus Omnitrophota bacterium]
MPISFDIWMGGSIGSFAYFVNGKRRRVTYANLKAAFAGKKSPRLIKRISRDVYKNVGQTFVEMVAMTKVDKKYVDKYIHIENFERIQRAATNPKGMILVSAHFGNWELSTVASVFKGFPLYLLTRDQKMEKLSELLNLLRESKGNVVVRKGMDIKKIFHMLKEGKSIGILADQNAGASGELIELFKRPARTVAGPYRIAQKTGAFILPAFIHRVKGPYHKLVLEEPMAIAKDEDVIPFMRKYNRLLEEHVNEYPEQWFWMHKRWKATTLKKIMVLDDGKKGHLKQSMAVVKQIEGVSARDIETDVVRVEYKNRAARVFLNALAPFIPDWFQLHLVFLEITLKRDSYENIVNRYADIIVGCGSSLVAVNRLLKLENVARNVAVLDPGLFNRSKFDLVVIPEHDVSGRLAGQENVIVTQLAPNLIDPEELDLLNKEGGPEEKESFGALKIGVLIGGDNRYFGFPDTLARSMADALRKTCEESRCVLRITTSRRTPASAEVILKKEFDGAPFCGMFVSGRIDTDERTVEKIMADSDVIIVSGESISMVSEAVSSGKPVLVFMPDAKSRGLTKYEKFIMDLKKKDYVRLVRPEDIPGEAARASRGDIKAHLPDDNRRICEKLYKLF